MVELGHYPKIAEYLSSGEYTLKSGVFFVPGAARGAIYDTNTGNIFSLNQLACQILTGIKTSDQFWENLISIGLVTTGETEKNSILAEISKKQNIEFVWLEINSDCNVRCLHCYANNIPPTFKSFQETSPLNHGTQKNLLTAQKWKDTIKETYDLGCRSCQFIGGEPFLYSGENKETVLELAEFAKTTGCEFIEIFTNGTLLTDKKIATLKNLGINIAVTLYSHDPQIHDKVTNTYGSWNKTMKAVKKLKAAGIPIRVETVLMKTNETTIEETIKFIDDLGVDHKSPDVLRPTGRGNNQNLLPYLINLIKYSLITEPNFSTDILTFKRNISGHSCLSGKITITESGDVIPCIFSRNHVVGNIQNAPLKTIIVDQKLQDIWKNSKDKVMICQHCEYRYACSDCRPLAEGSANTVIEAYSSAPYPRCTYNPYTGKWANGLWKLDKNSNPYYDELPHHISETR